MSSMIQSQRATMPSDQSTLKFQRRCKLFLVASSRSVFSGSEVWHSSFTVFPLVFSVLFPRRSVPFSQLSRWLSSVMLLCSGGDNAYYFSYQGVKMRSGWFDFEWVVQFDFLDQFFVMDWVQLVYRFSYLYPQSNRYPDSYSIFKQKSENKI